MTNRVVTFGCRLNIYESEVMKNLADEQGRKDCIIVNTCAVTKEAERQAMQEIRKLHREDPDKKIIVTGCSAQINPSMYLGMKEVFQVIGNHEKLKKETYLSDDSRVGDIMEVKEALSYPVGKFEKKARGYLQVQNGCNHRCTFCTIPYGRGNSRSVPIGQIVEHINHMQENGVQEIVLTGVDVTDYGHDLPGTPTFSQMLKRILTLCPTLKRLRLSSLDPVEVDDEFFEVLSMPQVLPHLHISLQAGDDMILKRMKRRHLRKDILDFCQKARMVRPDVIFGADIIAGFPTESDDMFENTRKIVEEGDLTFLHIFPYSPRPGTPAARMPQNTRETIKKRAKILRLEGEKMIEKHGSSFIGKTINFLVEKKTDHAIFGKTDHFFYAQCEIAGLSKSIDIGAIVPVTVSGLNKDQLIVSM